MGSGNPTDSFKSIGDGLKQFGANLLDIGLTVGTGGLAGYDTTTGKLKKSGTLHALDEGIGEVSGRNVQREMIHKQEANLAKAEVQRQQDAQDELRKKEVLDRQSSSAASSISGPGSDPNGKFSALFQMAQKGSKIGDNSNDFLGI